MIGLLLIYDSLQKTANSTCLFITPPKTVLYAGQLRILRDGPLFFIGGGGGGGGGYHFWDLQTFVLRVMCFKQFFSLHYVMKTIFLQPFLKNVTGFL